MRRSRICHLPTTSQASAPGVNFAQSLAFATDIVRRTDHEAIYAAYFYPASVRPAYLAIRAINAELAGLPDQVTTPLAGRMRFQWWREGLKSAFEGSAPSHPLLSLLSHLPQRSFLSPYHLTRLLKARESHFLSPSFASLQDLAEYSAATQSSVLYLLLQATAAETPPAPERDHASMPRLLRHASPFRHTGNEHEPEAAANNVIASEADDLVLDHAASHLGVALTITTLIRSIPHHARNKTSVIPLEVAARHHLSEEALFRHGPEAPGFQDAVATLAGIAEAELRMARQCFDGTTGIPKRAVPVFLSATPARSYLARLADPKFDFNPFSPGLQRRNWKLPFRIWYDARRNAF
ncbi:hypothetical protein JCM11641_003649 [Rhodosporidiobolus odoratus]